MIAQDGLGQSYARNAKKVEAQVAVVGRAAVVAASMTPVLGDAMDVVGCVRRDYWSCASLVPYADVLTKSKRVAELARSADRVLDASRVAVSAAKTEDRAADTVRRVADTAATPLRRVDTPTPASISQPVTTHTPALNPTSSHRLHTTTDPPNLNNPATATEAAPFGEIGPAGNPGLLPTQQHHVFPQKYRSTFENAGVAIDDFTVPLNRTQHLKGVHGSGLPGQGLPGRWNQRWGEWLDANPGAGAKEIFQQGGQMMDDFGLGGLPIGPYKGVR